MTELIPSPDLAAATDRRAAVLFEEHRRGIFERADRRFAKALSLKVRDVLDRREAV